MPSRTTVLLTGPNSHLGLPILEKLLEKYFVIGVSRNASKIDLNKNLLNFYLPLDIDLSDFKEDELLQSIKEILLKKKLFMWNCQ